MALNHGYTGLFLCFQMVLLGFFPDAMYRRQGYVQLVVFPSDFVVGAMKHCRYFVILSRDFRSAGVLISQDVASSLKACPSQLHLERRRRTGSSFLFSGESRSCSKPITCRRHYPPFRIKEKKKTKRKREKLEDIASPQCYNVGP